MYKNIVAMMVGALMLTGWPLLAQAHTHLEKTEPAKDAVVMTAPQSVKLWFNGKVSAEWAKINVVDAQGKSVDNGQVTNGDNDPKQLQIGLHEIAAGSYRVQWSAVSGDGHRVKGEFSFSVR